MYLLKNLQIPIQKEPDIMTFLCRKIGIFPKQVLHFETTMRSIDARHRDSLKYNYTLLLELDSPIPTHPDLILHSEPVEEHLNPILVSDEHPFIIGTGPAGLFCALGMVEKGLKPYLFDRGDALDERCRKVNEFWEKGILDPETNVQFGEGGAGTFSDGKLTARNRSFFSGRVYHHFIQFGADESIQYDALPHLGTDLLKEILRNIRAYLEERGCRFFWKHKLDNITMNENQIREVTINGVSYCPEIVILAIGNAARDTFELLREKNIPLQAKPFAIGFRIEHKQDFINERLYGKHADLTLTGPATYRLTAKYKQRGVYSFCMCPGGEVIAASSESKMLVTNGMSNHARNGLYANSAIVTSVDMNDFGNDSLAGMRFQRQIESAAFNENYAAPIQKATDFLHGKLTSDAIITTYKPMTRSQELTSIFPQDIVLALKSGLITFSHRIEGFTDQGILIAPETRTSSPIRVLREQVTGASIGLRNLYPIGEGSGYAGGIISSAVDGYRLGQRFSK